MESHQQAFESKSDAGTWRQTSLHCFEQAAFAGEGTQPEGQAVAILDGDAAAEFSGVAKFVVTVAEFDAVPIEFESFSDRRGIVADDGEGGLGSGIIVEELGVRVAQVWFDALGEEQVEPVVALLLRFGHSGRNGEVLAARELRELLRWKMKDASAEVALECGVVSESFEGNVLDRTASRFQSMAHQRLREGHLGEMIVAGAIPFEEREFWVVAGTRLAVSKGAENLENGTDSGGEQSLVRKFRGSLQEEFNAGGGARIIAPNRGEGFEVSIDDDVGGKERGFDFEIAVGVEKGTDRLKQRGALAKWFQ